MNWIEVVGRVSAHLIGLMIAFVLFVEAWSKLTKRRAAKADDALDQGRRLAMARLAGDAWWFSEDVPTMNALHRLAAGERIIEVREAWREEREKSRKGVDVGCFYHGAEEQAK